MILLFHNALKYRKKSISLTTEQNGLKYKKKYSQMHEGIN